MAATTYRFMPWVRRGLADRVADEDDGGALPARAKVSVGLTVSSIPEARRDLDLYGPGDVVGVDPRLIVRCVPRPRSTDVEPNYFAQIEVDPPDFPWLFTPARSGTNDQLRPWCVLIVVDLSVVAAPQAVRGQPLPVLEVPAAAVGVELPDLAESWAWAHAQAVAPEGNVELPSELAANPALNASRIVAPRRLEAGKQYAACLVPAFDAGVTRGLGDVPGAEASLGPAWRLPGPGSPAGDVRLPVYFHWEFATGPQGDFESLARRLQPFRAPASMGVEPMYVGDAGPELPALAPDEPGAILEMDGALRPPKRSSGTLEDVAQALRNALRTTLDAAAEQAAGGADDAVPAFGPPVYGAFHASQHRVPNAEPVWLRELNLDPRARAAAGLGAEIERVNQEDFMQWCWEQVGRILEANRLMSRARLSLEVLARVHERHLATLPADRLFGLAAPLHGRTKHGAATIAAAIARSSLPDAAGDPALRRLTSPRRRVLRAAGARSRLVARLATGELDADPTRFVPDGIVGVRALGSVSVPASGDAQVNLAATGLDVTAPASVLRTLGTEAQAAAAAPARKLAARGDLRTTGILVGIHRKDVLGGGVLGGGVLARGGERTSGGVGGPTHPHAPHVPVGGTHGPLDPGGPLEPGGPLDPDPGGPGHHPPVLPPRVKDPSTIGRFERSLNRAAPGGVLGEAAPERKLVRFDVPAVAATIVARTDPRRTVPRRLGTMLIVGDRRLLEDSPDEITVPPTRDRIMAAPELDVPVYAFLARLDPARFLPGVGEIPEEAITLLETNPRFVEGLLVGLNTEMNRELLWREFPTDQRGTPFRHFWTWTDGKPDIEPIHSWEAANILGANARGGPGGQTALLVRGRLLRRYPNTVIYAWKSAADGTLRNPPGPGDLELPAFAGVLGDDIAFVGFNLTDTQLTEGDGWFFVLQEQPTEPRFGFDEIARGNGGLPALTSWSEATWEHTGTAAGAYLTIAGNPLTGTQFEGARFVDDSAHLAKIALQKPFRVAVHARSMVEEDDD